MCEKFIRLSSRSKSLPGLQIADFEWGTHHELISIYQVQPFGHAGIYTQATLVCVPVCKNRGTILIHGFKCDSERLNQCRIK